MSTVTRTPSALFRWDLRKPDQPEDAGQTELQFPRGRRSPVILTGPSGNWSFHREKPWAFRWQIRSDNGTDAVLEFGMRTSKLELANGATYTLVPNLSWKEIVCSDSQNRRLFQLRVPSANAPYPVNIHVEPGNERDPALHLLTSVATFILLWSTRALQPITPKVATLGLVALFTGLALSATSGNLAYVALGFFLELLAEVAQHQASGKPQTFRMETLHR
jgi:hypothetical protein